MPSQSVTLASDVNVSVTQPEIVITSSDVRIISSEIEDALQLHRSAADPHTQYLTQTRADLRYANITSLAAKADVSAISNLASGGVKSYSTANRPSPLFVGHSVFDTTLNAPLWWNGSAWVVGGSGGGGSDDTTPPGPVTYLEATPTLTSITLAWTNPNAGDLDRIVVRRAVGDTPPTSINSGTNITVNGIVETVTDSGLPNNTQYSYSVFAVDYSNNASLGTSITVSTLADTTPPGPVTALNVVPQDAFTIGLTWIPPTDTDFESIVIRRATGSTPPTSITSGTSVNVETLTSTFDEGLTAETTYSYAVFALDNVGNVSTRVTSTVTTPKALLTITTTGADFKPWISLYDGMSATVEWLDASEAVIATGLQPTINFGSAATRTVHMRVSNPYAVEIINFGFNNDDDIGPEAIGTQHNWPAAGLDNEQIYITGVSGVTNFKDLRVFCAASRDAAGTNRLRGVLNLNRLAKLEFVECFFAKVEECIVSGCSSMRRLCLESNNLSNSFLDINPLRHTLRDLRAAYGGGVVFSPLDGPMEVLYHYCVRDQPITNNVDARMLPALYEYLGWNNSQTGTVYIGPRNGSFSMYANKYSTLTFLDAYDVNDTTFFGSQMSVEGSPIRTINNMANGPRFKFYTFTNCGMPTSLVDHVINTIAGYQTNNGTLNLLGNWPRSAASDTAYSWLQSHGWTVNAPEYTPTGQVNFDVGNAGDGISTGSEPPIIEGSSLWTRSTDSINGSYSAHINPRGVWAFIAVSFGLTDNVYFRWYQKDTALVWKQIARVRSSDADVAFVAPQEENRHWLYSGNSGATLGNVQVPINTWHRYEWHLNMSNKSQELRIYTGNGTTPIETINSWLPVDSGDTVDNFTVMGPTGSGETYVDAFAWDYNDWVGPV